MCEGDLNIACLLSIFSDFFFPNPIKVLSGLIFDLIFFDLKLILQTGQFQRKSLYLKIV